MENYSSGLRGRFTKSFELVREVDNIHKNNFRNKAQRIVTLAELFDVSLLSIEHRLEDIDN